MALTEELMGNRAVANSPNSPDGPTAAPNIRMTLNAFNVVGDIDYLYYLYVQPSPGHDNRFGEPEMSVDLLYRIQCVARNAAAQTSSRIVAMYACMLNSSRLRT